MSETCIVCGQPAAAHLWDGAVCPSIEQVRAGRGRAPVTRIKPIPTEKIMSNKGVDDLRNMLFDVIDGVRNGEITLDRAKMVAELAQVVVNSAKAEVDFVRAAGGKAVATGFLGRQALEGETPPTGSNGKLPEGITGVTTHHLT